MASHASILRDVDSAWAPVDSVRALLRPYKQKYLAESAEVRDTVKFAYTNGGVAARFSRRAEII
jgi:hypothetical protein